ncbi:MAG: hypothetical protein ACKOQ5_08310, partial [Solirubrobacterales bacterium]
MSDDGNAQHPDPTAKKGRLQRALQRVSVDLSGEVVPGSGLEGSRAIEAEKKLQLPVMIAAALTLPSVILMETQETGWLLTLSVILNWG